MVLAHNQQVHLSWELPWLKLETYTKIITLSWDSLPLVTGQ
jgi:hypothetical protein